MFNHLFKRTLLGLVALVTLSLSLTSAALPPPKDTGLAIGATLPEFSVLNQFGDKQQFNNAIRKNGAIVVLFRSADWCPFCKRHLLELNEIANEFYEKGYGLMGISYDSPKILREFSQAKQLKFPLLADQNVKTFEALKVVNTEYKPGDRHYGIPFPGVLVVSPAGKIEEKYFFEGYRDRVKFKELLMSLNK